ncbi:MULTISPECIES: YfcZ/YiiS family protein [Aliagarivorans]|uniref:YfcZ/YiiS family protein n=1 Tax=Aliagarivorans TaxID=882379 RepID=UPI000426DA30|nr:MULTISPECIES: DUF406 family protein [Aliagarivorans]
MKTKLEESKVCCCVDVGAIIDGEECSTQLVEVFQQQEHAQARLDTLTTKARNAESEPCDIQSEIVETEQGFQLSASFGFSCQAENLIFQLGMNR